MRLKLRALCLSFILAGLMGGSPAGAQTWKATTYLQAGSSLPSCPKPNATYEFTVTGDELSVKAPSGATHRGKIEPDGNVTLRYDTGHSRIGWITISGNVRTRSLTAVSTGVTGCVFELSESAPTDPSTAYTGTVGDWALGKWNGLFVESVQGVGLQSTQYSLMIERQQSGKVLCRFSIPEAVHISPWAQQCKITADTVTVTRDQSQLTLQRLAEGRLEGTMKLPHVSGIIRLTR